MTMTTTIIATATAASAAESSCLDIETCLASELTNYLARTRFSNDLQATREFLEQCLQAAACCASQVPHKGEVDDDLAVVRASTKPLLDGPPPFSVSCVVPRCGKVELQWTNEGGIQATKDANNNNNNNVVWSLSSLDDVTHILIIPKPQDISKSTSSSYGILLHGATVTWNKKSYSHICLQVSADPKKASDGGGGLDAFVRTCAQHYPRIRVIRITCDTMDFASFTDPRNRTTTAGLPFVSCHLGTKDGFLFPLKYGLLFGGPKVWQFWPRQQLHSIAAGRGGGRYVDLQVTLDDDNDKDNEKFESKQQHQQQQQSKSMEFTNIGRDELPGINQYIHGVLIPAMERDVKEGATKNDRGDQTDQEDLVAVAAATTSSSSGKEDDNNNANNEGCRPKRKAKEDAVGAIRKRVSYQPREQQDSEDDDDLDFELDEDDQQGEDDEDDEEENDDDNSEGDPNELENDEDAVVAEPVGDETEDDDGEE